MLVQDSLSVPVFLLLLFISYISMALFLTRWIHTE